MAFTQNEDDELILEAALNFIDGFANDSSSEEATGSSYDFLSQLGRAPVEDSHSNSSTVVATGMLPAGRPSQSVRKGVKYELEFLREKVNYLEGQLQSLQMNLPARNRKELRPRRLLTHSHSQVSKVWKELAERQHRRREDTERENAHLKVIVKRQRKVAVELSAVLRKRAAEWRHIGSIGEPRGFNCVSRLDYNIEDFQELLQHLEETYTEVDTVLAANGLATMEDPTHDVVIRDGDGGQYLEFYANKFLPFGLSDTSEAAWKLFKGMGKHSVNGELYNSAVKDLDQPYTIIEDFTKELYSNNCRADIRAKQIVRRFVEADREVIVFVSKVAPVEIRHKALFGLTYRLRGFAVAKRSSLSTPEHEMSLLQLCSRIYIFKEPGVSYASCHSRTLAKFLIGNTIENMRCYQERIENDLMDSTIINRQ